MVKDKAIGINLKQEIDKVEDMKNRIVSVKNRINEVIVRGGGKQSNTLNDMPDNIIKMLRDNYNKVATINTAQIIPQEGWIQIPTGTSFLPKYAFVSILASDNVYPNKLWWDTRENLEIISRDSGMIEIGLSSAFFTKDFIKFYKESRSTTKFKIENITFIG